MLSKQDLAQNTTETGSGKGTYRLNSSSFLPLKLNADHSWYKKDTGSAGC